MGGLSVLPRTSCGQSQLPCCRTSSTQAPSRNSLSSRFGAPVSRIAKTTAATHESRTRPGQTPRAGTPAARFADGGVSVAPGSMGNGKVGSMGRRRAHGSCAVPRRCVAVHPELEYQEGPELAAVVAPALDVLVEKRLHRLATEHLGVETREGLAHEGEERTSQPGRERHGQSPLHAPPRARRDEVCNGPPQDTLPDRPPQLETRRSEEHTSELQSLRH